MWHYPQIDWQRAKTPARRPSPIRGGPPRRPGPIRPGRTTAGATPAAVPRRRARIPAAGPSPVRRPVRRPVRPAPANPAAVPPAMWTGAAAKPACCGRTDAAIRSCWSAARGCAWPTANGSLPPARVTESSAARRSSSRKSASKTDGTRTPSAIARSSWAKPAWDAYMDSPGSVRKARIFESAFCDSSPSKCSTSFFESA